MDPELLRTIPLFAGMSPEDRQDLIDATKPRDVPAHETIFWIGERGNEMFIIQRGKIRLSYVDEAGHDVAMASLGPGQFFGELSLLDGGPRTATARSETDAALITLDRKAFFDFLNRHPQAAVHMVAILGARQRESIAKLRAVKNVNEEVQQHSTALQRIGDRIVSWAASGWFFVTNLVLIVSWISYHTYYHAKEIIWHDDPPTFFWLCLLIAIESIMLTILVLNAQKRAGERARIRDELEYQINLKAQTDVTDLHRKIDALRESFETRNGTQS